MAEDPEQRGSRIVVVEDDRDTGEMVVKLLREAGYDPVWETTGRGALEALRQATVPPDLIILDLLLPDISGEEVYAGVTEHADWGSIPVIIMSGLSTGATRASALRRGVYIQKPFSPSHLLALVAQYCGQGKQGEQGSSS
jgi:DNA-binding response OmpR family regulator